MNRNHVFNKYVKRTQKLHRNLKFAHVGVQPKTISELYITKRMNMFQFIIQAPPHSGKKKKNETRLSSSEQMLYFRKEVNRTIKFQDEEDLTTSDDSTENTQITENEDTNNTILEEDHSQDSSSYKTIKIWVDGGIFFFFFILSLYSTNSFNEYFQFFIFFSFFFL